MTCRVRERITGTIQRIPHRLLMLVLPSRIWLYNSLTMPSLFSSRAERYRTSGSVSNLELGGFVKRNTGNSWEHCFAWKILWAPRAGIKPSIQRLRSAPFIIEDIFTLVRVRCQGLEEPKSPQETRQVLDKESTPLQICRSKVPEKHVLGAVKRPTNAYRTSSRWHTRAWAQAVIRGVETDVVKRLKPIRPKMCKWT